MNNGLREEPLLQGKAKLHVERLLIATVGGSPEPVVYALREAGPGRVFFVCSQDTVASVNDIIAGAAERLDGFDSGRCDVVNLGRSDDENGTPAHEDLPRIVSKLHGKLDERVMDFLDQGPEREIYVDFTGGTKAMSAALVFWAESLAGRAKVTYQYIGGKRASEGRGVVQTGEEQPRVHVSPWEMGRQRVLHDYMRLFDAGAYAEAAQMAEQWRDKLQERGKLELEALRKLAEAFLCWELFDHNQAAGLLQKVHGSHSLRAALGSYATDELFQSLRKLGEKAQQLAGQQDQRLLLMDVLANAERRLAEGRYDDATARAYRAIEAAAQITLKESYGIDTAKVSLGQLPECCKKEFEKKFTDGEEAPFGLQEAYKLLACLDRRSSEDLLPQKVSDCLSARNSSILAHGWRPVSDKTARALVRRAKELTVQLVCGRPHQELELVKFPRLADPTTTPEK